MNSNPLNSASRRLRQNRPAMWSLGFIVLCCLVALFAYPLAPDNSPDANRMIVELGARPPGFSKRLLRVPRTQVHTKDFFHRLFSGTPPKYSLVPLNSFFFARDTVYVAHYIDEGLQDTLHFTLKSLLPPRLKQAYLGTQQAYIFNHAVSRYHFWLGTT